MEEDATPYPDAPWRQDRSVVEGRPQRRVADLKAAVQGFEASVVISPWAIFIAGVVVGASVVLYVTYSKQ